MTFSSAVKNEIAKKNASNSCCMVSEFIAMIRFGELAKVENGSRVVFKLWTENINIARRIFLILKNRYKVSPSITIRKDKKEKKYNFFQLILRNMSCLENFLHFSNIVLLKNGENFEFRYKEYNITKECCRKAYLKGAFLMSGSMTEPSKTYHLEFVVSRRELSDEISDVLKLYSLNPKMIKRKNNFVIYLKEGEDIADFLNIIGAHNSLMELENIRIMKGVRNDINRIVNCETSNLEKTVKASLLQIEDILYIKENCGLENIPLILREIAEARLKYQNYNFVELGAKIKPPIGKSGVCYRLRKLHKIAENIRQNKGELI